MMENCPLHERTEADITRLRDDVGELYEKSNSLESRIVALEGLVDRRASDISRLESAISKLEGMIQALSAQIQALQAAPAKKVESRWESLLDKLLWLVISGGIGVIVAFLIKGGF